MILLLVRARQGTQGTFASYAPVDTVKDMGRTSEEDANRWIAATDGSCLGAQAGRAGWAWAVSKTPALFISDWNAGGMGAATSYHAELTAFVQLLHFLPPDQPVEIRMDSMSVLRAAAKWRHAWKENEWRRVRQGSLAHVDLVIEMDSLLEGRDIELTWVRAHLARDEGDPLNFFVDRAARAAARNQTPAANVAVRDRECVTLLGANSHT